VSVKLKVKREPWTSSENLDRMENQLHDIQFRAQVITNRLLGLPTPRVPLRALSPSELNILARK
jgi:hypothetical protein